VSCDQLKQSVLRVFADSSELIPIVTTDRRTCRKLCTMLAMPLPVAGERQGVLEYLKYQHTAFLAVSHGLTDEPGPLHPDGQHTVHRWAHQACDDDGVRVDSAGGGTDMARRYDGHR
jgi:hypothetical protein